MKYRGLYTFFSLSLSRYMCVCVLLRTPVVIAGGRPRGKTIWVYSERGGIYVLIS